MTAQAMMYSLTPTKPSLRKRGCVPQFAASYRVEATIYSYLRHHAANLGARIIGSFPPLQRMTDEIPGRIGTLLRKPLPAQATAIAGLAKFPRLHGGPASWPNLNSHLSA